MKTFTIRAIFKILREEDSIDHFDEQLWLLSGASEVDVFNMAMAHGFLEDEVFQNLNGRKVHWKFLGITEIRPVVKNEISLISSRTIETDPNSLFEKSILLQTQKLSVIYNQPIKFREFDH